MKIEDQVCSFEQAKKLHLLGLKVETIHRHGEWKDNIYHNLFSTRKPKPFSKNNGFTYYPAPTVAELGVLLGKYKLKENFYGKHWVLYQTEPFYFDLLDICPIDTPEAQARAEALIWLIENGYIDPKTLTLE
jgi:hypothetical protein